MEELEHQAAGIQSQPAAEAIHAKQTRFKLEQDHSNMSTFGRKTIENESQSP